MYKFTVMVENAQDAKYLASAMRGVAATNSIQLLKEDGNPVVDGDPKACTVSEIACTHLMKRAAATSSRLREENRMEREKMLDAIYAGLLKEAREAMEREQLEEHYAHTVIEEHKLSTDAELAETLENMEQAGLIEEN